MDGNGNVGPGDIKAGLLRAASELSGGPDNLARSLGISEAMLRRYVSGSFPVPDSLILRALDLMQEQREELAHRPAATPTPDPAAADPGGEG